MTTMNDGHDNSQYDLSFEEIERLARLSKDAKAAALTLSDREARFLVDTYYRIQDNRKRSASQSRSLKKREQPNALVGWLAHLDKTVENSIKAVLLGYAKRSPIGVWSMSNYGIGPVIAAGLSAYIDITKAPTVGHIWSFAGLHPGVVWEKGTKRPFSADLKCLCVRPDQHVTTKRGHVPISNVVVGDEVLTHLGRWRKVTEVLSRPYDGVLHGLSVFGAGGARKAWLTPEHPVYAQNRKLYQTSRNDTGKPRYVVAKPAQLKLTNEQVAEIRTKRGDGTKLADLASFYDVSESYISMICSGQVRTADHYEGPEEVWIGAGDIVPGMKALLPTSGNEEVRDFFLSFTHDDETVLNDDNTISACGRYPGSAASGALSIPQNILITEEVARMLGFFVSEGHSSGHHLGFSHHREEHEYQDFTESMARYCLGLNPRRYETGPNAMQVLAASKIVAHDFAKWFGKDARTKIFPYEWVIYMRPEIMAAFLRGLFEGDGWLSDYPTVTTSSNHLAMRVVDALSRLGLSSSLYHDIHTDAWKVSVHDADLFYKLIFQQDKGLARDSIAERGDGGFWYPFSSIDTQHYQGMVYNLEVDEDHSYVVEGMAVHNCWKIGMSFLKFAGSEKCFYGHLYRERKAQEWVRNLSGALAGEADRALKMKKFDKESTVAYQFYNGMMTPDNVKEYLDSFKAPPPPPEDDNQDGVGVGEESDEKIRLKTVPAGEGVKMLPPLHIDARARRWVVKLFLSHWQFVAYKEHYKTDPPKPYILTRDEGHAHYIAPPGYSAN